MERVSNYKYLGVDITEDLVNTLRHSGEKGKAQPSPPQAAEEIQSPWGSFSPSTAAESVLTGRAPAWVGNSSAQDRSALQ